MEQTPAVLSRIAEFADNAKTAGAILLSGLSLGAVVGTAVEGVVSAIAAEAQTPDTHELATTSRTRQVEEYVTVIAKNATPGTFVFLEQCKDGPRKVEHSVVYDKSDQPLGDCSIGGGVTVTEEKPSSGSWENKSATEQRILKATRNNNHSFVFIEQEQGESTPFAPTMTTPTTPTLTAPVEAAPPSPPVSPAPPPPPVTTPPPPAGEAPPSTPIGQTGTWNLAFDDEFNNDASLNLTKWIMCNPSFASSCVPYNDEQEIYNTVLPSNPNVNISGGNLSLVATKQNGQIYSGMVSTGPNVFNYAQPGYTGFQFTYGYVDVAVKLPKGDGFWPAVWLLPNENTYGPWPGSGEYDISEVAGNDPTTVYMTEHDGENGSTGDEATDQVSDTSAGYHVFGFDWEPDHLAWYIDGKLARTMICTDAYAAANPTADCDSYRNPAAIKDYPFFINMNLSVGGNWSALDGAPDSSTPFPSTMSIKWIRVWQHPTT